MVMRVNASAPYRRWQTMVSRDQSGNALPSCSAASSRGASACSSCRCRVATAATSASGGTIGGSGAVEAEDDAADEHPEDRRQEGEEARRCEHEDADDERGPAEPRRKAAAADGGETG